MCLDAFIVSFGALLESIKGKSAVLGLITALLGTLLLGKHSFDVLSATVVRTGVRTSVDENHRVVRSNF
jgi:hypothetical protein